MTEMSVDVLAVIYAPLEKYPPTINQVALLAESGLRVAVVDCYYPGAACVAFGGNHPVQRIRAGRYTEQFREPLPNGAVRLLRLLRFKSRLYHYIRRARPKVVIAYDTYAFYLVGTLENVVPRPRLVWHFHELPGFMSLMHMGGMVGQAEKFIRRAAHRADMWIVPDSDRAALLSKAVRPPRESFVVMNCPRRLGTLPGGNLKERLRQTGFRPRKIVLFQGSIDGSRCLETLLASMSRWPADAGLVLLGPVESGYKARLLRQAMESGMSDRVLFLDPVPYRDVFSYTVDADVCCCLVQQVDNMNWDYSAGAINKRFEYMAVGVPQVTNRGTGMAGIVSEPNAGLLVDPRDSGEVGDAVRKLLIDESMHATMARDARKAHLSIFNYEAQFRAPLELFTKWVRAVAE